MRGFLFLTTIHHPRRSFGSLTSSWPPHVSNYYDIAFSGQFTLLFSLFSYSEMLSCFYFVMCLCCLLFNLIRLGCGLFISEVIFFSFFFCFFLHTFFLLLLFTCLIEEFVFSMVVSIRLCHGKGFFELYL